MTTHYLGFDIGGTHARCALIAETDGQFKILSSQKHSIRGAQTPRDIALIVRHVVEHVHADTGIDPQTLKGLGIAIAGQISVDEHTVINAPNLNWHNVDFYAALQASLADLVPQASIRIANDLNAIAWGEYEFGAARSLPSLLAIYVGTGIGAGLIIDHKLMVGADNVSGEIGHTKFPELKGIPCGCGQTGCIEGYAGGKAIEYRILHDIQNAVVSREELGLTAEEHPTARCIEAGFRKGLPYAVRFWDETALMLGMLVANAIAILNPHALLLGGGVLEGCPSLLAKIIDNAMEMAPRSATAHIQFIKPTLHDDAGTLGAALLCLSAGQKQS